MPVYHHLSPLYILCFSFLYFFASLLFTIFLVVILSQPCIQNKHSENKRKLFLPPLLKSQGSTGSVMSERDALRPKSESLTTRGPNLGFPMWLLFLNLIVGWDLEKIASTVHYKKIVITHKVAWCSSQAKFDELTLCTRQQKRHWCIEQSYGLCGRGRGWEDLGEWHWNM